MKELLDEYAARRPELTAEIDETLALARRALQPAQPVKLPAPRYARLRAGAWRVPFWALGMAACFVAGMAATRWTMRPAATVEPAVAVVHEKTPAREEVVWISPVRMPVIKTTRSKL
jgi:hypothetical protein